MEIWWASPTQWKREVRSPEFHQVEIVNGDHDWQKNEGDFFPEWLRRAAIELTKPVPPLDQVLEQAQAAEKRQMGPMTNLSWTTTSGTAEVRNILRSSVAWQNSTGLLLYGGGMGWGGEFKDHNGFHGRMVARTVSVGSPQVTAKVTALEDLGEVPAGFFDATAPGGDPQLLQTILIDEIALRKNLLPAQPPSWPTLQDGPLQGNVTTIIVVDREGKVREIDSVISENSAMNEVGRQVVEATRFKPFLVNGQPVQVLAQFTTPFKTTRPAGTEAFDSPQSYFEKGRKVGFAAAGTGKPYLLRAEFEAKGSGGVENGRYEDTWLSESQWRREAWWGTSHYVRSRNGEKTYQFAEGPETGLLRLVLRAMEPIPAIDTFTESDWRIKRDTVDGVRTVRVVAGHESPDGKLDPEQSRGYWFDDSGLLLKNHFNGIEMQRAEFQDFEGVRIAHRIDLWKNGGLGVRIRVTEVSSADRAMPGRDFEVRGHEWKRAFTDEVR